MQDHLRCEKGKLAEKGNPQAQRRRYDVGVPRELHTDVVPMRIRKHVVSGRESTGDRPLLRACPQPKG